MKQGEKIIVRAYGNKPLERIVCGVNPRVVYVSRPDLYRLYIVGKSGAVGFPKEDAFEFDQAIYEKLSSQFESGGDMDQTWSLAIPAFKG